MQTAKVVFDIPLNTRNIQTSDRELDKGWLDYRIKVMCTYTIPALIAQKNKEWSAVIGTRKETLAYVKNHKSLRSMLSAHLLEDKVFISSEHALMDFRCGCPLIQDCDFVIMAHLDSDDIYHPKAVDEFLGAGPFTGGRGSNACRYQEVIRYHNGYFYQATTGDMHVYSSLIPPFYAQVWSKADLHNPVVKRVRHHTGMSKNKSCRVISMKRRYIVVIHGENKSSKFRRKKTLLTPKQIAAVRREFPSLPNCRRKNR